MQQRVITQANSPDRSLPLNQPPRPVVQHAYIRPSHVDTAVAALMLLVAPETMLKSHSLNGHYSGIRPVRLPSRKLAWPIAAIEKLLNGSAAVEAATEV
ncbi:hypothetical protein [Paraburkholderia terricola]|jgi:hypothetical protein|uniref:hypothetical protein n=1 Tax=Paraburkholderia terricola TaxID=169427 RepID=UPI000DEF5534|nr:hypothetical protein [Paraburkholderia terricola]AXE91048.1 hypothetical protein CUJ90_00755 [Paraburkholderia terricola]